MKAAARIVMLLAMAGNLVIAERSASSVTPVQKVVQLLKGMEEKGKAEKHDEQVQFAAYKQFCDDTEADKKRAIDEANDHIEILKADIEKYTADVAKLSKEITGLDEDITVKKGDMKAATKVRKIEKGDFDKMHKDYSESIDALERAIVTLKKQDHSTPQAAKEAKEAAMVQVAGLRGLNNFPTETKNAIEAFLQDKPDEGLDVSAPEAEGYEFQSQGVIDMLDKLLTQFVAENTALEKEEMGSVHAFELLMQDLKTQIEDDSQARDTKSESKAKKLQAKATALGDLKATAETLNADEKYLADLTATCDQKSADFEARQQLRTEELEAVAKAIEIIRDGVEGHADKHLPALVQVGATSLVSLRAEAHQRDSQARVTEFLNQRAKQLDSRVLEALASRSEDSPFTKVKKMIKDLIVRLMDEANEEASHKGWCDTELSTNEQTRKEKTDGVETLHAEIDQLDASIAKLTEDVSNLATAIAELDAAMAKATKLRQDEKTENAAAIADAQAAQTAVAQALTVLKEFYSKAAEATALLQQEPEAPEIFDSPYKGMQGENGGVVGMLEVIQSDFARLEAETKAAEANAQKEYDTFMTDSKVDKTSKKSDLEHKTDSIQDQKEAVVKKRNDLEATQKELDAALAYFDKLKPSCVDADVSYEDRVARRKEEIISLQEALKILNGEDIP